MKFLVTYAAICTQEVEATTHAEAVQIWRNGDGTHPISVELQPEPKTIPRKRSLKAA